MSATEQLKQQAAAMFYRSLKERTSFLQSEFIGIEKPLPLIGGLPYGITGRTFQGVKAIQLMTASNAFGFTDPRWFTTPQLNRLGYFIRKGEKALVRTERLYAEAANPDQYKSAVAPLFNGDQIKNLPSLEQTVELPAERYKRLDAYIQSVGAVFNEDPQNLPYYSHENDTIYIEPKSHYAVRSAHGAEQYYTDALYAITEWAAAHSGGPQRAHEPGDADSQYRLRVQLACVQAAARLGVGYERDPSGWEDRYIQTQPNWRELESAWADASAITANMKLPEHILTPVPARQLDNQPQIEPGFEERAQTFDPLVVVHVSDSPKPEVAVKVKRGVRKKLEQSMGA